MSNLPAMGRQFTLGFLYDIRRDIIVNKSLWNEKKRNESTLKENKPFTHYDVAVTDTLDERSSIMKLDASVKMSFMSGLISVSGSANYFNSRNSSARTSCVSAKFTSTRYSERLTMDQLGYENIDYPSYLSSNEATHVISQITYGNDAFFKFEKEVKKGETKKEVGGSLKMKVKSIPGFKISGEGEVDMKEEEKKGYEGIKCEFFGDFTAWLLNLFL